MIVLDTHIWLWWINDDQQSLGSIRQEQIASAEVVAVSAISCFEVAWLERHRRIALPCPKAEWFDKALSQSGIVLLPISPAIATRAVDLHEHHTDPQDRIIIASAIEHNARLMSDDSKRRVGKAQRAHADVGRWAHCALPTLRRLVMSVKKLKAEIRTQLAV